MTARHPRLSAAALVVLTMLLLAPAAAEAGARLTTGFVPELATPTVDVYYRWNKDAISGADITLSAAGLRLSYVPYPALETFLDIEYLVAEADILDATEEGLGAVAGVKYGIPELLQDFDISVALRLEFGQTESFTGYGSELLGLISYDIAPGLSPYGAVGFNYNRQEIDGPVFSLWEDRMDPVAAAGIRYTMGGQFSLTLEASFQEDLGFGFAAGYRF